MTAPAQRSRPGAISPGRRLLAGGQAGDKISTSLPRLFSGCFWHSAIFEMPSRTDRLHGR
jgi:hypothetical protein